MAGRAREKLHQLWQEIAGSRISAFAWADVLVTVLTILACIRFDAGCAGVQGVIWPVLAAFLVGASLALPLYLYLREVQAGRAQAEPVPRS